MSQNPFTRLLDSGAVVENKPPALDIGQALDGLLSYIDKHESLSIKSAWRLSPDAERKLIAYTGLRPPYGWPSLVELAAGCGYLRATRTEFVRGDAGVLDQGDELNRRLLESMTKSLVPPHTAAGLFIVLGIHPAWGLRLAWEVQKDARSSPPPDAEAPQIVSMIPTEHLSAVRQVVFNTLACIAAAIRRLDRSKSYSLVELYRFIGYVCTCVRDATSIEVENGVPVFLEPRTERVAEIFAREFVEDVLFPAGVVRLLADKQFVVFNLGFESMQVDNMDVIRQDDCLTKIISGYAAPEKSTSSHTTR